MLLREVLNNFWYKVNQESSEKKSVPRDAEFIGWQKTYAGKAIALYNITAKEHPLYHSTVSEKTLREQHLQIPPTPPQLR